MSVRCTVCEELAIAHRMDTIIDADKVGGGWLIVCLPLSLGMCCCEEVTPHLLWILRVSCSAAYRALSRASILLPLPWPIRFPPTPSLPHPPFLPFPVPQVVVLERGRVAEFGSPASLLADSSALFSQMVGVSERHSAGRQPASCESLGSAVSH